MLMLNVFATTNTESRSASSVVDAVRSNSDRFNTSINTSINMWNYRHILTFGAHRTGVCVRR